MFLSCRAYSVGIKIISLVRLKVMDSCTPNCLLLVYIQLRPTNRTDLVFLTEICTIICTTFCSGEINSILHVMGQHGALLQNCCHHAYLLYIPLLSSRNVNTCNHLLIFNSKDAHFQLFLPRKQPGVNIIKS